MEECYQVKGTCESAGNLHKLILAMRRVSSKCQNILNSIGLDSVEGMLNLLNWHVCASQVHHRLHAYLQTQSQKHNTTFEYYTTDFTFN